MFQGELIPVHKINDILSVSHQNPPHFVPYQVVASSLLVLEIFPGTGIHPYYNYLRIPQ